MSKRFPNSGILFATQNAVGNQPSVSGTLDLDEATIRYMLANLTEGVGTVRLAGWKRQGSKGPFLSLKASTPREAPRQAARDAVADSIGKLAAGAQGYGKKEDPDEPF